MRQEGQCSKPEIMALTRACGEFEGTRGSEDQDGSIEQGLRTSIPG